MVLPPELHIYAENILRRFPEEFMALGAPNLEEGKGSIWGGGFHERRFSSSLWKVSYD